MQRHTFLSIGAVAAIACTGCTTRSQVFDGYGDDQVWTAMVAAARTPAYDDWKVVENDVFVDDATRRIEIYRSLKRLYVTPFSDPRRESEEWRFRVELGRDESLDAPEVFFTGREIAVPAHVWDESDRFFRQMRTLLGPMKAPEAPEAKPRGEEVPMPPPLEELDAAAPAKAPVAEPAPAATPAPAPEPLPER